MKKKIIVSVNFNNINMRPERLSQQWIDYRLKIFYQYSFKSMVAQTNSNFECLFHCDKESISYITSSIASYYTLPNWMHIGTHEENRQLITSLSQNYEQIYIIQWESDMMYQDYFIDYLYNLDTLPSDTKFLINYKCYFLYNDNGTYIFAPSTWKWPAGGYVLICNTDNYDPVETNICPYHAQLTGAGKCVELPEYLLTFVIHQKNAVYKPSLLSNLEIIENPAPILKKFGLKV